MKTKSNLKGRCHEDTDVSLGHYVLLVPIHKMLMLSEEEYIKQTSTESTDHTVKFRK